MKEIEALLTIAGRQLRPIAGRSGRILYSAANTLRRGSIYLLGLNPGGDPTTHSDTVGSSLGEMRTRTENAYLDESWGNSPIGRGRLQRRVQWLLQELGFHTREVCASNLIFTRSIDATGSGYPEIADLCWPVHEEILKIVQPQVIVPFGNSGVSPYRFLRSKFRESKEELLPSGHGVWSCTSFKVANGVRVVGLPHLSRYAVNKHPPVPTWIKATALQPGAPADVGRPADEHRR